MRVIRMELKNTLFSRKFIAAVGIGFVLLLFSIAKEVYLGVVNEKYIVGFHNELFLNASKSQLVVLGLSVICAVPFATSYIADAKSKYILLRLTRNSKKEYILGKIITAYLTGGCTVLLSFLLFYLLLFGAFVPIEIAGVVETSIWTGTLPCLWTAIVYSFVGGFFSLAAFLLGSMAMNYYIAYVSSFILFYMLVIFHERYLQNYGLLDPKVWLTDYMNYPFGIVGVIGMSSALSILGAIGIYVYLDRRLLFE